MSDNPTETLLREHAANLAGIDCKSELQSLLLAAADELHRTQEWLDKFQGEAADLTLKLALAEQERDRRRFAAEAQEVILAAVLKDRDELREAFQDIAYSALTAMTKSKNAEDEYGKWPACPVCEDPAPHEHLVDPAEKPATAKEQDGKV